MECDTHSTVKQKGPASVRATEPENEGVSDGSCYSAASAGVAESGWSAKKAGRGSTSPIS